MDRRVLLVVVLVAALSLVRLVFLLFGRRWRRRPAGRRGRGVRKARGAPSGGPVLRSYLLLEEELDAAGRVRVPGETFREVAEAVASSTSPASPAVVDPGGLARALALLERECYGAEPLSAADVEAATAIFDELCRVARTASDALSAGRSRS